MSAANTNRLLDSLPADYRAHLKSRCTAVSLPQRTPLFHDGETPRNIYFITSGMLSVVSEMSDGNGVEIAVVGHEGVSGWLNLLGPLPGYANGFMQVDGTGLRMPFKEFREEFEKETLLRHAVLAFAQHQTISMGLLINCNRRHSVEQRLARWLLMVADRVNMNDLNLTQEFLAEMLGSRRTSVALSAGALQKQGLIHYQRGRVTILDRRGLKATACECYGAMRSLLNGLYK